MSSLEHRDHLISEVIDVIKAIDAQVAKNGQLSPFDFKSRVMEVLEKGVVAETSYSGAHHHEWDMLSVGDKIVALFAGNQPVIYLTMTVGWAGCPEAGSGIVKEIITPARALSYWPENMVVVEHPDGLFRCHPFHLHPFTKT